jgi:hypothetical protein
VTELPQEERITRLEQTVALYGEMIECLLGMVEDLRDTPLWTPRAQDLILTFAQHRDEGP